MDYPVPVDSITLWATVTTDTHIYTKFSFEYGGGSARIVNGAGRTVTELAGTMALTGDMVWTVMGDDGTTWSVVRATGCRCSSGLIAPR